MAHCQCTHDIQSMPTDKSFDVQYYQKDRSPQATRSHQHSCELHYCPGPCLSPRFLNKVVKCISAAPLYIFVQNRDTVFKGKKQEWHHYSGCLKGLSPQYPLCF